MQLQCDPMVTQISQLAGALIQILFVFALSPLLIGVMRKVKAIFQGRSGASILQPYLDVLKLLMKGTVKSNITSWIFIAAPILLFASTATAAIVLPIFSTVPPIAADIIVFIYLFAIGRFLTALSGLDAGSSFGGLGTSREMLYSSFIEPALFAAILFLVIFSGGSGMALLATNSPHGWFDILLSPPYWLAAISLFILILAETGRLPFDNPATHLELTMVHEAMILENSGPNLALIEWSHAAKIFLLFALFANIFLPIPITTDPLLRGAAILASALVLGVITAAVESISVKVRLFKVAELLVLALAFSVLAFLSHLVAGAQSAGLIPLLVSLMLVSSLYFIFSATFKRRIELYLLQSLCVVAIFAIVAMNSGGSPDAYLRLGATILLKVLILPVILYGIFMAMASGEKMLMVDGLTPIGIYRVLRSTPQHLRAMIDMDPMFFDAPIPPTTALVIAILLVAAAFLVSTGFSSNLLLPLALSIVLVGLLIIATKTHMLLQLLGFLMMENGIVLLPLALGTDLPLITEATTLFDMVVLIIVSVVLVLKIRSVVKTADTAKLAELMEKR